MGRAVFARHELPPGTIIGDYVGQVISDKEIERRKGLYGVFFNEHQGVYPRDPKKDGVHVINHSCAPNCGFYPYKGHVICATLRRIFPGEELYLHYYLDPPEDNKPTEYHPCFCQHPLCTGTMHTSHKLSEEFTWEKLNKKEAKLFKKKAPSKTELKPFDHYPKTVPDHYMFDMMASRSRPPLLCSDSKLPGYKEIRKRIRESGKRLKFTKLGIIVEGIFHGEVICRPLR